MKLSTAFLKKLPLGKVLMAFLAGVVLLVTTACNAPANDLGARPNNPPVQMGGSNNPHKGGGDGYTEYKTSTDRAAVKGKKDRASLLSDHLIASAPKSNASDLLYPESNAPSTENPTIGPVGAKGKEKFFDAKQIPAERQPVLDRSDPNVQILERSGQAFKDASGFLKDARRTAVEGSETEIDPGVNNQ